MATSYDGYSQLSFDRPHDRVLRITIDNEARLNALNADGHRELTSKESWE